MCRVNLSFCLLPISRINISLWGLFLITRSTCISNSFSLRAHCLVLIISYLIFSHTCILWVLGSIIYLLPHNPRKVLFIPSHWICLLLILWSLHLALCHSQRWLSRMTKVRSSSILNWEWFLLALPCSRALVPWLPWLHILVWNLILCLLFNLYKFWFQRWVLLYNPLIRKWHLWVSFQFLLLDLLLTWL